MMPFAGVEVPEELVERLKRECELFPNELVRPFVRELAARGDVTAEEWCLPLNSYERHELVRKLKPGVFLVHVEHCIANCDPVRFRPPYPIPTTYDESLACTLAPELISRLRGLGERLVRAEQTCGKIDALAVRAMLNNWRGSDDVTFVTARTVADQILSALDALSIVLGYEKTANETDTLLEKVFEALPRRRKVEPEAVEMGCSNPARDCARDSDCPEHGRFRPGQGIAEVSAEQCAENATPRGITDALESLDSEG